MSLFAALPAIAALREPLYSFDEGLLLVYPEQILAGEIPNRDFFTAYGPGGLSLLALVYAVVGPTVLAERAVGLAYHVAVATGLFAMTRRLGPLPATSAGIAAGLLLVPLGLGAYVWLGAIALFTWSLALLDSPRSTWTTFIAGVVGALAISWRPETAVMLILASLPHVWRTRRWRQWGLGVAAGTLPLAVHASLGGWRIWSDIAGRIGESSSLRVSISDYDLILASLTTLAAAGYLAWRALRGRTPREISWAAASVLVLPQMLQRLDLGHVLGVACLIVPLALATAIAHRDVSARLRTILGARSAQRLAWVSALLCLALLATQALAASTGPRPTVTHDSRSLPVLHKEEMRTIDELLYRVDASVPAAGKVFLGARDMSVPTINDIRLYHLLPRHDAFAYHLELPPPQAQGSALLEDIRGADALILRHVPRSWGRRMVPFIPSGDDAANDLVARQFCLTEKVYPYDIYLRCGSGK